MAEPGISIRNLGLKYGLLAAVINAIISILLDVKIYENYGLWAIFFLVITGCVIVAYRDIRSHIHMHRINYLPGLGVGIAVSLIAAFGYALYKFIHTQADPDYVERARPHLPFQDYTNGGMIAFWDFWILSAISVALSFVVMQFFKRNRAPEVERQEEAAEKNPEKDLHPKI